MIKITKEKNKYLIEYIDYLNHYDYLEEEEDNNTDVEDEIIKAKINKVKIDLQKLINDAKAS